MPNALPPDEVARLRRECYNATLVGLRRVHEDLLVFRVRPDEGVFPFEPGQYTSLGLGRWERRVDAVPAGSVGGPDQFIRRAYSISCPILDEYGRLVRCSDVDFLEFYVTLVRHSSDDPPTLTPRLFALEQRDRLFVGTNPRGHYTLEPVGPRDNVLFLATGTGETPHNAMAAELLARGHPGRIACVTCVRYLRDLAYRDAHEELQRRYQNYRYVALTTREPYNLDAAHPRFVGKQYIQDYVASGAFSRELDWPLVADGTHVFLCGNPAMIGLPKKTADSRLVYPEPPGMVELLDHAGFTLDRPHRPGHVHFEKYW